MMAKCWTAATTVILMKCYLADTQPYAVCRMPYDINAFKNVDHWLVMIPFIQLSSLSLNNIMLTIYWPEKQLQIAYKIMILLPHLEDVDIEYRDYFPRAIQATWTTFI